MSEQRRKKLQDSGLVEWSVFSELVAMDDDEEGFSLSLFQTFVDQVRETFAEIDENLKKPDLDRLLALGHYLKGSAAALGLTLIVTQCERIQNYGKRNNFDHFDAKVPENGDDAYWVALIEDALEKARDGFERSKAALSEYFEVEL